MSPHHLTQARWSTACFAQREPKGEAELLGLGDHLQLCKVAHARWFAWRCATERMSGFAAARFVSSVLLLALALGLLGWLL